MWNCCSAFLIMLQRAMKPFCGILWKKAILPFCPSYIELFLSKIPLLEMFSLSQLLNWCYGDWNELHICFYFPLVARTPGTPLPTKLLLSAQFYGKATSFLENEFKLENVVENVRPSFWSTAAVTEKVGPISAGNKGWRIIPLEEKSIYQPKF